MIGVFAKSFSVTFLSVLQIFIVIFFSGFLMRMRWITREQVTALSKATVLVFLPCMIFSNIIENLNPAEFPSWWILPLSALAISGVGIILGAALFLRELPVKKSRLALTGFQNASYLVLPLGKALFPNEFNRFALYSFLFVIGFNLILWSVGKYLSTERNEAAIGWRDFVSLPFITSIVALILVLSGTARYFPSPLLKATHLLGEATVPVATFVLGAVLGSIPMRLRSVWVDSLRVASVKLLLLPALIFLVLMLSGLSNQDPLLANFFIIQASSAPAVGIILQVRTYGGDEEKIGTIMLLTYACCMCILPAWIAAWNVWGQHG